MSKLFANRYELIPDLPNLASDRKSANQDLVEIQLFHRPKHNDLFDFFLARAKEISDLNHPNLARLLNYGYDGPHGSYYLIYENVSGKQLSTLLQSGHPSLEWSVSVLLEICNTLNYLHTRGMTYGDLMSSRIWLDWQGELPLKLASPGLTSIEDLLDMPKAKNPESNYSDSMQDDIDALSELAAELITRKLQPDTQVITQALQLMPAMKHFFSEHASVTEARYALLRVLATHQAETYYFLILTRGAQKRLFELGFISHDESTPAVHLLSQEVKGEVFGRAEKDRQGDGNIYYFTTARFRLLCRPDQRAPEQQLAIVAIEAFTGIGLVTEREKGLPITSSLQVIGQKDKPPSNAQILPLLQQLDEHKLKAETTKRHEVAKKSGLGIWPKVLELQRRLLNEFQLAYINWELTDGDSAILVQLTEELDSVELSGDERLRMNSNSDRKSVVVGFFEELDGEFFKIGLAGDVDLGNIAKHGKITIDNVQIENILKRQNEAFRRLKFNETVNPGLFKLLTDPVNLEADRVGNIQLWDQQLDLSQQKAVRGALATKDIFLVQGPPGTGKTTAIVEIVRQLLADHHVKRILIASQSNVAVNHALLSLIKHEPGLKEATIRVGREEKAGEAGDILLDRQMLRWAKEVKTKSQAYLEKKQKELSVDPKLMECLSIIEECEAKGKAGLEIHAEIRLRTQEYEQAEIQIQQLLDLMTKLQTLRQRASVLLDNTVPGDESLQQLLQAFQANYLGWGEEFLTKAEQASQLSVLRAELKYAIKSLIQERDELGAEFLTGQAKVREILQANYKIDLPTLKTQQAFIRQRVNERQQDTANQFSRLQKVATEWQQRVGKDGSDEFVGAFLNRCKVVGATCIGIAAKGDVSDAEFDVVIVDEAGRATHPELLVPLVRGRKIILVGDHRQLPPILDKQLETEVLEEIEVKREDLETSLFKELIDAANRDVTSLLQVQYRMHPMIGDLISQCFYEGQLKPGVKAEDRLHQLSWCSTPVIWYSTHRLDHHEESKNGFSFQNIAEAEVISSLLDKIERDLARQNINKTVGIITGYMGQKRLLRQKIPMANTSRWPHLTLEIDTVDAYQGREMQYIIYSVVRSNPGGEIGFLRDERRLNVALSRAQELLIIVGDRETTELAKTRGHNNPFFTVIQYIRQNPKECTLEDLTSWTLKN